MKFLKFVREDSSDELQDYKDTFVKQLQNSIQRVKQSREMERQYMLLEDLLKEERKAAEVKIAQGFILDVLEKFGNSSEKLHDHIMSETNINTLKYVFKIAVKADTLEEFEELISNL